MLPGQKPCKRGSWSWPGGTKGPVLLRRIHLVLACLRDLRICSLLSASRRSTVGKSRRWIFSACVHYVVALTATNGRLRGPSQQLPYRTSIPPLRLDVASHAHVVGNDTQPRRQPLHRTCIFPQWRLLQIPSSCGWTGPRRRGTESRQSLPFQHILVFLSAAADRARILIENPATGEHFAS